MMSNTFSRTITIILYIYILTIVFQCIVSQPISDDSSQLNSNILDSSILLLNSNEFNSDNNNNKYEQDNQENLFLSPVRRANFWKRANFWRKRANFWRRDLAP